MQVLKKEAKKRFATEMIDLLNPNVLIESLFPAIEHSSSSIFVIDGSLMKNGIPYLYYFRCDDFEDSLVNYEPLFEKVLNMRPKK